MLDQKILEERQRLEIQLKQLKQTIQSLPDGKLICSQSGKYFKWYVTDGHAKTYLPQSQRKTAEQLAFKKYLSLKAEKISQEITSLDFYLRHHPRSPDKADLLLSDHPGYKELLQPYFTPLSQELADWAAEPF